MKLLLINSLYPPHCVGGYEIRCKDVVKGLKRLAHHEEPGNLHQDCKADIEDIGLLQYQTNLAQFREAADQKDDGEQEDEGNDEFFQSEWSCN